MKTVVLLFVSLTLLGCVSTEPHASEWPSPFPMYVSNRSDASVWVVWTFGAKEERTEVIAGDETKILPPFVTDSAQPLKKVVAIENAVVQFDLSLVEQPSISSLQFVVKDATTVEVYRRGMPGDQPMVLKGKPIQSPQTTIGSSAPDRV
jgi:hypothetical protein